MLRNVFRILRFLNSPKPKELVLRLSFSKIKLKILIFEGKEKDAYNGFGWLFGTSAVAAAAQPQLILLHPSFPT